MKDISRRQFFKTAGAGALAMGAAIACGPDKGKKTSETTEVSEGMPLRTNPNSGDKVSLLGYGCMRWQMIKDENGNEIIDQNSVNELVDYAISHGVNYFDSAPVYLQGQSERATAKALLRYPRESYFIATKSSRKNTFEEGVKMYKQSLANYETDYLDYYLLHALSGYADLKDRFIDTGLLDYFLSERKAGHIRNLGFSFHGSQRDWDELIQTHETYHWDFIQIQMNYLDWYNAGGRNTNAAHLYKSLDERGIPIVIMEPLRGGGLSSVPKAVADEFKSREPEKSIASWAFRFVGSYPRILTVLSGMTYMEHLQDNLDTYLKFKPLTEEEKDFLTGEVATRIADYPLVGCTSCQYCMPCPFGIDIPGIFSFYNKSVNDGSYVVSREQEKYHKLRKRYLLEYNKAIPTVRQADHCINCQQCMVHCPQHIRIPQELRRIDRYIESLKQETL